MTAIVPLLSILLLAAEPQQPARSKADWASLRDAKFALPAGERAFDLLREMNALLASTDPFLRDNVAYESAVAWIYTGGLLSAAEQREILEMWLGNLRDGLDEPAGDGAFKRSFSALNLSIMAAREQSTPFLSQQEFDRFVDAMLDYLARERDLRGYEPGKGWIHAAAHTADVLKFLARSSKLAPEAQSRILAGIEQKCESAGAVFAWAEDERLAQIIVSLARRPDLNRAAFESWLTRITAARAAVWKAAPAIDVKKYHAMQNLKMVLRAAYVTLALDTGKSAEAAATLLTTLTALR